MVLKKSYLVLKKSYFVAKYDLFNTAKNPCKIRGFGVFWFFVFSELISIIISYDKKDKKDKFKLVRVENPTPLRKKKNRKLKRKKVKEKSHHKATKANWARVLTFS